jgi:hypothetical protein
MRLLGGPMVKLVDTRDLKSLGASCTGSSPVRATNPDILKTIEKNRKQCKKIRKSLVAHSSAGLFSLSKNPKTM